MLGVWWGFDCFLLSLLSDLVHVCRCVWIVFLVKPGWYWIFRDENICYVLLLHHCLWLYTVSICTFGLVRLCNSLMAVFVEYVLERPVCLVCGLSWFGVWILPFFDVFWVWWFRLCGDLSFVEESSCWCVCLRLRPLCVLCESSWSVGDSAAR